MIEFRNVHKEYDNGTKALDGVDIKIEKGDLKLDCDSRRLFVQGKEINLTGREFELLELLVKNENKVYSREKLLEIVWGKDYPGDVRTVDVHVKRLREKIKDHEKWQISTVWESDTNLRLNNKNIQL